MATGKGKAAKKREASKAAAVRRPTKRKAIATTVAAASMGARLGEEHLFCTCPVRLGIPTFAFEALQFRKPRACLRLRKTVHPLKDPNKDPDTNHGHTSKEDM